MRSGRGPGRHVGRARAVDVGQADALLVEQVGTVEPGRVVHRDLGAEPAVAQVGPVADLAVADAHQVGEAVAGHVGQVDRLRAVGEDQARALLLVERLAHLLGRAESVLGQRLMPGEDVVFGDQDVGMSVARQVDELEIRVVPGQLGNDAKGRELIPALVLGALEEAGRRARRTGRGRAARRRPGPGVAAGGRSSAARRGRRWRPAPAARTCPSPRLGL